MSDPLEQILEWSMDETEAKAFKLALLWQELCEKEYPKYPVVKLKQKGDPRKSVLFKYCYKLVRETDGIVADHHYRLYIRAQLQVFKSLPAGQIPRIDPNILVGERAWRRWMYWKHRYDKRIQAIQIEEGVEPTSGAELKTINDLEDTRVVFQKHFGRVPTAADIAEMIKNRSLIRWITLGKISPVYAILSPFISKALDGKTLEEVFLFDLSIYRSLITPKVEQEFRSKFTYEF